MYKHFDKFYTYQGNFQDILEGVSKSLENDKAFKDLVDSFSTNLFRYKEVDGIFIASLDVPGCNKNNVDVSFQNSYLVVKASPHKGVDAKPVASRLLLTESLLDLASATASVEDGLLSVKIPRKVKAEKSAKVSIKVS